jgi:transportin-3
VSFSPSVDLHSNSPLDGLENLEVMLHVIGSFGEELPVACQQSYREAWAVIEGFVTKYGTEYGLAERATRVIRHGLTFFGDASVEVAPSVVARMSFAFEASGIPSYLWIAGKVIRHFGNEENQSLRGSFQEVYERSTAKMESLLQSKLPRDLPDGNIA